MQTNILVAIAVLVVIVVALAIVYAMRAQRSRRLHKQFGPEYDRTVEALGDRGRAEQELAAREDRRRRFEVRDLDPQARARYLDEWRRVKAQFVDEPRTALTEADRLVTAVMKDRGYPVDDFDQAAADVSVDYPREVEDYRKAHEISVAAARDQAGTEDMRVGMQHYRELFASLVGVDKSEYPDENGAVGQDQDRDRERPEPEQARTEQR